ncbi:MULTISPECIES: ATP-binding protein [Falsihalocynthiibacter]|uniref:ATP-binding protein n=1 Tax=Falsihalocynthiibacter TaxID=2854182 RepID=UPI0030034BC5
MVPFNALIAVCLTYVVALFLIAFFAEKRAAAGKLGWLQSPLVYTLSLSIYCTAWTFYGAVGYAARSGLEFATIYIGPTIVMIGWWWFVRKLVRVGKMQRITSIADLISSRFGKSTSLGVIVTLMAVVGSTPYIALQLQSVTLSFSVFATHSGQGASMDLNATALWVAIGLAVFTVLFGTRNLDANERHHGVVTAIAVEAVVKLVALLSVGIFVVWGVADGMGDTLARIDASPLSDIPPNTSRWISLTFLSAAAFICLPRMFQVMVVENSDERHVATASWAFPLYLFLMCLFVLPIAVVGLELLPNNNPDLFVLSLPLSMNQNGLAMLSFLGGFSSATSMVVVAAIALSTMVSNHIVMPLWLSKNQSGATVSGDVRRVILLARRTSIAGILGLGYIYYRFSGGGAALAAIGLISFAGVAQFLPALVGGMFWRGATRIGAIAGLLTGFAIWAYALFLPSLGANGLMSASVMEFGPFGISWLAPQSLFGIKGLDPVVHAIVWSTFLNTLAFCTVSLLSFPSPLERLQGAQIVNAFEHSTTAQEWRGHGGEAEDLLVMSQRILGADQAQKVFLQAAKSQGKQGYLPDTSPDFLSRIERELAGSVGAATAHAMVGQIVGGAAVSVEDLMAVADETAQMLEYSSQLENKTAELGRTALQLREVNEKLTELSIQKDAFLSQISHELRTPMTSIRAFSEILREEGKMTDSERKKYSSIIHDETQRLTRLLDDLLDISVLENGQVSLNAQDATLGVLLDHAVSASISHDAHPITVIRDAGREMVPLHTDSDRLTQVFINLISNAQKYCDAETPVLRIHVRTPTPDGWIEIIFGDNGSGISNKNQGLIFEKFSRLGDQAAAGGAGLGLAICREIMINLGGEVSYLPGQSGAAFRVSFPSKLPDRKVTHAMLDLPSEEIAI